jgi:energy-coupling factor transporter ATP-binding protein EcfA2
VFGILLHQRGLAVLQASSVKVNGRAVLFLGHSGAGKSTLATALAKQGYPLVTDDFCVVGADATGRPQVHPDARLPKLWAQAIHRLDLADRQGPPVRRRLSKFYVDPPLASASATPLPCGPVYVLREARAPYPPGIARPNIVDAALLLRQNAYRARLIKQMGQGELYFRLAAAVSNAGGVFQLTRELDFEILPDVIADLERHWAAIGRLADVA